MENMYIILGGIRPNIQFNHSDTSLQGIYDGHIAAVAAQLVSSEIGVVAGKYEVMS